MNDAHRHHYVPQFFLRNFAVDSAKKKITTVAKHGSMAIWAKRSIEHLGYECDLYLHLQAGVPVSVESAINENIENPISQSDTWAKIVSGRTDALDRKDKPILYALIRHLQARNPHFFATGLELAGLGASNASAIPFIEEERDIHDAIVSSPDRARSFFNAMSASLQWTEHNYRKAAMSIFRSPIPLRSSTVPVISLRAPSDKALHLPLPGMVPYLLALTLNRTTIAMLVLGDFDDAFRNTAITAAQAKGFNRQFVCQFAYFGHVRHLITDRDDLVEDMTWAPYEATKETQEKITFRRRN